MKYNIKISRQFNKLLVFVLTASSILPLSQEAMAITHQLATEKICEFTCGNEFTQTIDGERKRYVTITICTKVENEDVELLCFNRVIERSHYNACRFGVEEQCNILNKPNRQCDKIKGKLPGSTAETTIICPETRKSSASTRTFSTRLLGNTTVPRIKF
ncbi:MAG: hypothetical protein SFW63_00390 [Alphaproteobacteria bacterium]|nr:hypothetical protein [Alphaproteobacteria bacterium]